MNDPELNILYITQHLPLDKSYGAQIRVLNTLRLLQSLGKVSLVLVPSTEFNQESLNNTQKEFDIKRIVRISQVSRLSLINRIRHELDPSFLITNYGIIAEIDRQEILRMIAGYDVVWVHTVRIANAFQISTWPHSVLDVDDIPSRFYAVSARNEPSTIRRLLDYRMSIIWWRRERLLKKRFDVLAVCSKEDQRYLGNNSRIHVIPNGFALPSQVPTRAPSIVARLGFIGAFSYEPNRVGIEWFIRNIWPLIKRDVQNAHLRLVGEGSDRHFSELGQDIQGLGWVADPSQEISSWAAMIIPIRVGGGTRVKIAEAFSRKCPVVSTSLGATGYEVVNGQDLLIADDEREFASACILLLKDSALGLKIAENAWEKFLKSWTWDSIGESVRNTVKACLEVSRGCPQC